MELLVDDVDGDGGLEDDGDDDDDDDEPNIILRSELYGDKVVEVLEDDDGDEDIIIDLE